VWCVVRPAQRRACGECSAPLPLHPEPVSLDTSSSMAQIGSTVYPMWRQLIGSHIHSGENLSFRSTFLGVLDQRACAMHIGQTLKGNRAASMHRRGPLYSDRMIAHLLSHSSCQETRSGCNAGGPTVVGVWFLAEQRAAGPRVWSDIGADGRNRLSK
jgi:hypothetical protein